MHVVQFMLESTLQGKKAFPFFALLLAEEQLALSQEMIEWTGGAPGPLLFLAHSVQAVYEADPGLLTQFKPLFWKLAEFYYLHPGLRRVMVGEMDVLCKEEREAYDHFFLKAWTGEVFPNLQSIKHHAYLRSFNVPVKCTTNGQFQFVVPLFLVYYFKGSRFVRLFSEQGGRI